MTRYTKKDVRSIAQMLSAEAMMVGLLESGERVYVNAGNASAGIPVTVTILNDTEGTERSAHWLPRFTYKDTVRTQYKALEGAYGALRAAFDVISELRVESYNKQRALED